MNIPTNNNQPEAHADGNASHAFAVLGQFLQDDGWYPHKLDEKTVYRVGFSGKNGNYTCFAVVRIDLQQFMFYVQSGVKAAPEARTAVAEFLTRANYGLRIGNFELDMSDGEVRYKSSLDFEGVTLSPQLIKNAIYPAVQTMDRYFAGLLQVMYGQSTPADALALIEG
ncbi:MAG: YbjN domain-containing protein [Anaerolinea sp.]|nr:YbjN domain-containing protein [Anaerolinea sp.]